MEVQYEIAPFLPSGSEDPRAAEKLEAEQQELTEKLEAGDHVGALTELADVCYYAAKSVLNNLLSREDAERIIADASQRCGVSEEQAFYAMVAKYCIRAQGIKDDERERAAVVEILKIANNE